MTRATTYTEPTETLSLTKYDDRTVAGLLLFVLGAGFMTAMMLAAALVPGYDFRGGAISDLGVSSESALLFNGSLLVVGVLNLAGGYLLYRRHRKPWLLAIYALASVGAVGTGLFPLDTGDVHSLFALLAFLFFNLEAIGTATLLRGAMRAISVLAGVLGIVFLVLMAIGDGGNTAAFGPIGHGGTERMIVYPVMLWLVAFGGYLLGDTPTPTDK
ncbi:DUF998 domain-containing protein [Haloarchaeobius salinus]|uniref:DUF998 domain-containing protein n=1 Tax=Haloarchaeobius salinus TaxID=1198298 RepID=UPI002108C12E|nr:DUF998 domain-containing protein [Haloarchaeobius salinus]